MAFIMISQRDMLAEGLSLGTLELAVVLSSVLYGICIIQTYHYYMALFKNDGLLLRLMVFLLLLSICV